MTTTSFRDAELLDAELERRMRLEESLLIEVALTHHGYSVRLVFDLTRTSKGALRSDLDEREQRCVVEMHGVQRVQLEGGLSQAMLDHPEAINWGLSEVALVRAEASAVGLQLKVLWEGTRSVVIDAGSAEVTGPEDE